jgi:hypothetical protein
MDPVIAANNESGLLQGLYNADKNSEAGPVDYFFYYNSKNCPNMSRDVLEISNEVPITANFGNKEVIFTIPKYGLITHMYLQTTVTKSAANDSALDSTMIGTRLYSSIVLRSQGNIICTQTPLSCLAKIWDAPLEQSIVLSKCTQPSLTLNGATSPVIGTPILMPYFEINQHQMRLDAMGYEPLQIRAIINPSITGMGLAGELTAFTPKLFVFYRKLEYNAYQAYRANNFGPQANLNLEMLVWDTLTESTAVTNGTNETTHLIKCKNVAFKTNVCCVDAIAGKDAFLDETTKITATTLGVSGQDIYKSLPPNVIEYDEAQYEKHKVISAWSTIDSTAANTVTTLANVYRFFTFNHAIENNYVNQMGAISFTNTANPYVTITHTDPGNATTRLYVQHFVWKILQISPADGRLIIGNAI